MKTTEFDYTIDSSSVLPHDPPELRGKARDGGKMIVLDRAAETIDHTVFTKICDYFRAGDLVVLNDSCILSNTLSFEHGDQVVQVTMYGHEPGDTTIVNIKTGDTLQQGLCLKLKDNDQFTCELVEQQPDGLWKANFKPFDQLMSTLDKYGERIHESIHINPALWKNKPQAYRSVYSTVPGSLGIPSAGLHFSSEILNQAIAKGVEIAHITLHVGATETYAVRHITVEEIEDHKVMSEYFEVSDETAAQINKARAEGRRVIAIGSTVMRTLESLALKKEPKAPIEGTAGWTDLYIYPGFKFNVVDVLLTNLHKPRSSHIVLTASFAGKDLVMQSYNDMTEMGGYEFDMFGDSMLVV
ncbi:hypothetical protein ABW20_dc0106410 [Dactylellina cionopaga]|nr:hypothetical protein ABW20_dc0106410 [Dactylellina cionopaga]